MLKGLLARTGVASTVALFALLVPGPAQGAENEREPVTYFFQSTSTVFSPGDGGTASYHISGDANCTENCHPPNPIHGIFSIDFSGPVHPPSPCRVTNGSGTLTAQWSSSTTTTTTSTSTASSTTTATIRATFRIPGDDPNEKQLWLVLSGKVNPGDPVHPPSPIHALLQGSHPPDPCHSAYSGNFAFHPPNPTRG